MVLKLVRNFKFVSKIMRILFRANYWAHENKIFLIKDRKRHQALLILSYAYFIPFSHLNRFNVRARLSKFHEKYHKYFSRKESEVVSVSIYILTSITKFEAFPDKNKKTFAPNFSCRMISNYRRHAPGSVINKYAWWI